MRRPFQQVILILLRIGIDFNHANGTQMGTILTTSLNRMHQLQIEIRHRNHSAESGGGLTGTDIERVDYDDINSDTLLSKKLAFCRETIAAHQGQYNFTMTPINELLFSLTLPSIKSPSEPEGEAF